MYAVIRAGGKQYRVAPGDVIRVERVAPNAGNQVEFTDVLAVSGDQGLARPEPNAARVLADVVENGRGDKVLVFHFKRKKQYKKLRGHRQGYTAIRIAQISFDGQTWNAPEQPKKAEKKPKAGPQAEAAGGEQPEVQAAGKTAKGKSGKVAGKSAAPKAKASAKPAGKNAAKPSTKKKK